MPQPFIDSPVWPYTFTIGFVLLWFGVGALAAALSSFLGAGLPFQFLVFIALSIILTALSRTIFANYFTRRDEPAGFKTGAATLPGKVGTVVTSSRGALNEGAVKVFGSTWTAYPAEGEPPLEAGEELDLRDMLVLETERIELEGRSAGAISVAGTPRGVQLLLGDDEDLARKIALIGPILSQTAGRRIAAIDLRAPGTPVVVYRRTRDRMPARESELEEALAEGVTVRWLTTISHADRGRIAVERMELDETGFPQPTGEFETSSTAKASATFEIPSPTPEIVVLEKSRRKFRSPRMG